MRLASVPRANPNESVGQPIKMGGIISYIIASTVTPAATEELEITWPIPRYSTKKNQIDFGASWRSAPFSFKDSATNFFFNFYPKSENNPREGVTLDEIRKWTSIYFYSNCTSRCKDTPSSESPFRDQNLQVELSILDANEKKCFTKTFHRTCSELRTGYGSTRFVLQSELEDPANNLLPDDTLTIHCRIKKLNESSTVCLCPTDNLPKVGHFHRFSTSDYADFFNNETSVVRLKNCVFPAHKFVLGGRSPIFAAMFKHDMKEKKVSEVEIEDMEPAVFQKMLRFIYTNDCKFSEHTEELLMAADRYDIKDLKELCEEELKSQLTLDNALRLFLLSDAHNAGILRRNAILFINRNKRDVVKQPEWNDGRLHPSLTTALLTHNTN
jgi:BTB/POZ domain/MATH domain